jgi:radical SAM protein with 4Fe4S-binding SPASM domain
MEYPNLLNKSIFAIPISEHLEALLGNQYLVYAPLTDYVMLADSICLNELELAVGKGKGNEEIISLLDRLQNTELFGKKMCLITKPDDYLLLYILPNYKCNFSCSYCFSSKGRSNKEIVKDKLRATLDYFVDSNRIREKKLYITFLGGGEPMISCETVIYGIEYAYALANAQGIDLTIEIVTNGSIINENMLEILGKYNIQVRVSFEVLEDIQNLQRGQYDKVCETIEKLTDANLHLGLRAMITPFNVDRMEEMVATLVDQFPGISYYMFDPITDKNTFNNVDKTKLFYEKYQSHFFRALDIASHHGKQLKCAPLRNLNSIVERYCFGELCLTPEGTITICHRVSSPTDPSYQDCVYGRINESNQMEFDYEKYQQLIHSDTVYDNPDCAHCFVKWNCGGGCMVQNKEYKEEIRKVICKFTRNFSKEVLLRRIKNTI